MPGMAHSHHASRRKARAGADHEAPAHHVGVAEAEEGSADSVRMALATSSDPVTIIGESAVRQHVADR